MPRLSIGASRVRGGLQRVPRQLFRLTDLVCQQAGPGRHADGGGLYLYVRPTRSRSWIVRLTLIGGRRDFGLGSFPDVSLAEAREVAAEYRRRARKGEDPRPAGSESCSVPTVREAFEAVIKDRQHSWSAPNAARTYRARLERYILPSLESKAVDAVTVGDCYALIHPLWHGTGSKGFILRHQLVHVFAWAVAHEHRVDNPGDQVLRRLPKVKSRRKHRPSLPYVRVSAALAALDAADVAPVARLAISFLILTACRLREVTEARWSEFDLDDQLWTIPPSRMKKRRRHRVPLSTQALRILAEARSLDPSGVLVFGFRNGRRPPRALGSGQISAVLRGLGLNDVDGCPVVAHGFRATFTDWVADHEQASVEAAEAALAHAADSATRQSYRHGDLLQPRRPLMQKWADYVFLSESE